MTLAEMRRRYVVDEWTCRQIAEVARVHETTVRRRLRAAGVRLRRPGMREGTQRLSPDELDRSARLALEHGTPTAARILGISPKTLQGRIRLTGTFDVVGRRRVPDLPVGHVDARTMATRIGISKAGVTRRCANGDIHGAIREHRWPFRWLIPVAELDRHERLQALTNRTIEETE